MVRLYESHGGRTQAVLRAAFPIASAQLVDLLERPLTPAEPAAVSADGSVALSLRPFQVLTLRLARA